MSRALVDHGGPVTDLGALHDAFGCAAMAAAEAWRGNHESAALSLTEAHAAAEEAFGREAPEVDALNVVFAAITQAAHSKTRRPAVMFAHHGRPQNHSRLGQERTLTSNTTTDASPPAARSLHEICEDARRANCGECWVLPGDECVYTTAPVSVPVIPGTLVRPVRGYHVARFGRAMRRGLISGADLIEVLQGLDAFTNDTVVYDAPDGTR